LNLNNFEFAHYEFAQIFKFAHYEFAQIFKFEPIYNVNNCLNMNRFKQIFKFKQILSLQEKKRKKYLAELGRLSREFLQASARNWRLKRRIGEPPAPACIISSRAGPSP
jgi:hypothetical protein